ncbi:MAG TPA: hypothetical protein VGN72_24120 [Tepidisphaeraceae bacterium]|jgi:hypothetical protein|nr:hypothetical protein [Tepidisphaeraceae bacterium]
MMLLVVLYLAYVGTFTSFCMTHVPATLGGFRPLPVRFLLKTEPSTLISTTTPTVPPLLKPDTDDPTRSERRYLYLATDNDYAIVGAEGHGCIVFDQALVDGYQVEPKD